MSNASNVNYLYISSLVEGLPYKGAKVLDYGCGRGEVVQLLLEKKIDAYGVEAFFEGGNTLGEVKKTGLYNQRIFKLEDEKITFPDQMFDIVISNQVFEHIDDFSLPLKEIYRTLKNKGVFICIFPSKDVWRENHIGIPFTHWFRKGSRLRYYWVLIFRYLGFGNFKNNKSPKQWTVDFLNWLDKFTFYKDIDTINEKFREFFHVEEEKNYWIKHRIAKNKYTSKISMALFLFPETLSFFQRRLATRVFYLYKKIERNEVMEIKEKN